MCVCSGGGGTKKGGLELHPALRAALRAQDVGAPCLWRGESREPPSQSPLGPHCKGASPLEEKGELRELGWEVGDEGCGGGVHSCH